MKKRNDSSKDAKFSRSSSPDRERRNSSGAPSDRPSRGEKPRSRFGDAGASGPFKPKKRITEKLFNKPTLKKSNFKKLAFDSSTGRNPFAEKGSPIRQDQPERTERRPRMQEDRPFDKRRDDRRGDARRSDARRSDSRPQGEFRPRREDSDSRPPRRNDRDERSPRRDEGRSFDKRSDARRGDAPPQGEFRPRHEDGDSRPPRRDEGRSFDKRNEDRRSDARPQGEFRSRREDSDSRPPRRDEGRSFDKRGDDRRSEARPPRRSDREEGAPRSRETGNDTENRRVGKFTKPPRYDFSDYESKKVRVKKQTDDDILRLNRYISNAGICSRREADELIESGQITVNGKVVTEMGYKVKRSDTIKYGKKILNPERMVYLLINKPKDYITTTDDPEERKTVMDLVAGACEERIYPVGRLDRNTTGLLLLTNDGELAEKLTHPSSNIRKVYQAELDKPITTEHFEAMQAGFELEDGFIKPDDIGIVTPDAMVVGLEIHSGKNRIVRRMFENFGYEVKKLDRTVFAGLNKKDLPRGKWRFLSEKEVVKLKYLL
jgi:23S rRNA pseudouridine2605 synthase